ncbi:phage tail protein [Sphingobium bisphenolivorans]|uniref:phage tail protein n=1 Tax=Sphingobium bisphenolivorans TaxID=1335760 RepID=UPI0003A4AB49|nr:phage tail protein [Sphingobium bisphenolivorans]
MATIVLTALGTAVGGPLGAAIGGLIGNAFDHAVLFKPKGVQGRRLADVQVQTSTYGAQLPKLFGTMRVAGSVIWATDLKETKSKSGGGKGRPSVTTYSYSASFAVALSARAIRSVRRIWADGNLLRGAAGDFKTELSGFRLYRGEEDQGADPLIAASEGSGRTPAHRGIAYAVFEDLALADYGNRIPSLTFEVEADDGAIGVAQIASELSGGMLAGDDLGMVEGLAAGGADIGDAIEPLVDAFDLAFTADETGLRLRAPAREAGALIAQDVLCRLANGRPLEVLEQSAASAEAVPAALAIRYHDAARDYQAGVQRVSRPGPGRVEQGIDLPAVLSGDGAQALAARRLAGAWSGRATLTLRCGWAALRHQAGDIVMVEDIPGVWRIEEREWEAMAVRLSLRRLPSTEGAPPVGASSGGIVREADLPHGPTRLMLIDLPPVSDDLASTPVVMAAASGGAGWRGAALFLMSATGEAVPIGRAAPRAVMGQVDLFSGGGTTALVDEASVLHVSLLAEDMELTGADEAALGMGRNLCMAGRELIQFSRAVRTGAASFRLEGLRRGLRGTEWAMALHFAGENFLLVEEDRLVEVRTAGGGALEMGASLTVVALGAGDVEPVEASIAVSGEAVTPLAPVHLRSAADGEGGWCLSWTRRSRNGWRWLGGADVPLCEERELYDVRVFSGEFQVRQVETGEPSWTYDAAARAADGAEGSVAVAVRQIGSHALGRASQIILPL